VLFRSARTKAKGGRKKSRETKGNGNNLANAADGLRTSSEYCVSSLKALPRSDPPSSRNRTNRARATLDE